MAQRKQKPLEPKAAASVAQKARRAAELKTISEQVDANLNPTDAWRHVHPEHIEAIKTRLIGGDTLGNVCRALDLDRASVLRHFHEHPEILGEYLKWKACGAHALYENLLELPFDKTMSASDKLLYFKVVSNYAPKINRETYGDRLDVNATQTVQVAMPDWMFGQVVDAKPIEHRGDPDALEGIILPSAPDDTPKPD